MNRGARRKNGRPRSATPQSPQERRRIFLTLLIQFSQALLHASFTACILD